MWNFVIGNLVVAIFDLLGRVVSRSLNWNDFNLFILISRVLNVIHPMRNIFCESTAIRMNRSLLFVRIVDVLVFVNDRMESIMHGAMVREVVMRLFYEVRVLRRHDTAMKYAVTDGAMNEAVFVAQNASFIDVTGVDLSLALFTIFQMKNLQQKQSVDGSSNPIKSRHSPQGYH